MPTLVRIALQVVLFFMLLSPAMAIGGPGTGILEELLLAALGVLLVWRAGTVRRIGARA